ncbi:Cloroperoxidase [Clathrospora elynae]|uniref:Cloroperoxidase n=1 Tax=Clathrospora elynae TaxID=706981 RepID=A0A6A5SQU8_9PLEO|nr:Cloroperoxidase [Clathrospora elynae]
MVHISALLTFPLLGFLSLVQSFPTPENIARLNISPDELHEALLEIRDKRLLFDTGKPVDVSGDHVFKAPNFDAGDQRGPCVGLNALANHGYLPRDGIANVVQIISAANQAVLGMGIDIATLVAAIGTVFVGNPLSLSPGFSIDGKSSKASNVLGNLFGVLGTPRGLSASHNIIEADGSFTRDDLYVTGDAATMNMSLFLDTYYSIGEGGLSFDQVGARIAKRVGESVATNPNFYSGPYTGMIGRNGGYAFGSRLLSNHSSEQSEGVLSKEVFKSFWGVYDSPTSPSGLAYRRGHEQIPANWYRIPQDYTLVQLNLDLVKWYLTHPMTLSMGGNMGKVNSFVGIDLSDLTGGVLNANTILEGNGLMCFLLEVVKLGAPNSLGTLFKTLAEPLEMITDALAEPLLNLQCPEFGDLQSGGTNLWAKLMNYPGAKKAGMAF